MFSQSCNLAPEKIPPSHLSKDMEVLFSSSPCLLRLFPHRSKQVCIISLTFPAADSMFSPLFSFIAAITIWQPIVSVYIVPSVSPTGVRKTSVRFCSSKKRNMSTYYLKSVKFDTCRRLEIPSTPLNLQFLVFPLWNPK